MGKGNWIHREQRLLDEARKLGRCPVCEMPTGHPCRGHTHHGFDGERRRPHSGRPRLADADAALVELSQERALRDAIRRDAEERRIRTRDERRTR